MSAFKDLDQFIRMGDLANYPAREEKMLTLGNGKTRRVCARQESKGIIGVSEHTIYRWIKAYKFPQPVLITAGIAAFKKSEVVQWQAERAANLPLEAKYLPADAEKAPEQQETLPVSAYPG